jgi:competence protein ComEA
LYDGNYCNAPEVPNWPILMISRWAAWFAGIVIAATLILLVAIEVDRRTAPPLVITVAERSDEIQVEIAGAIEAPGVYRRERGDRVIDLIDAAGGLLPGADTSSLNQAALLADGQRVTVPFAGTTTDARSRSSPDAVTLIDLNSASADELTELPDIGQVRADAIVAFRNQNGPFRAIDDLVFVDGISWSLVESLRPLVTIGT